MPPSPTSIRSLGLALLLSLAAGPALAERVVGDWTVAPYEGTLPTRCVAMNRSDENGAVLTAIVSTYGDIQFVLERPTLAVAEGDRPPAEFLIDGRTIALRGVTALDRQTVQFISEAGGRNEDALLHGLERGSVAVVQLAGRRSTFTLDATAQAMALLSHCVGDPSIVASANVAERDLEAADDFPDEVDGDAAAAREGTDGALDALLDGQAAYAQLRCSVAAINLFGLFSANAAPVEFDLSINADATASVNGTTIAPLAHRMDPDGSGPSVSIYRAREILTAQAGSALAELFANAPRSPQSTGEADLLNAFTNPAGLIPKDRLIKVSLLNDEVTVADQLADGQFGNVSAHRCFRLR